MDSRGRAFLCTHLVCLYVGIQMNWPSSHWLYCKWELDDVGFHKVKLRRSSVLDCLPQENRQAHNEGGRNFRWSRVSENLFATTGHNEVKVFHLGHSQVPVSSLLPVTAGGGLSWHATLPVCAVGGDRKVHLWMTEYELSE
ncbi:nucleoporin Nup37-like [Ptychodera flava]|uniref:nucleoporin Nup37-like n=1 Tax=Ptychodera flava TaxID=63121 RepID=UPI00396A9283